jgi:hypothetical protein
MKIFYLAVMLSLICTSVYADTSSLNLAIPTAPQNYQSDKFRAGELDCSNAIGSATNLEFGVTGIIENGGYDQMNNFNNQSRAGDVGVYARIVIPLGKVARNRIDCNELYELELRKKQLEVMKLEQEIEQLRELQFEN